MTDILQKELSYAVVGAAMEVHRQLGPGFLESVYRKALAHELALRGISFEVHQPLPISYKGQLVGTYEADIVVEQSLILELKSVTFISPAHLAQAQHYLAATGIRLAILLNFGCESLQMKRVVK